MAYQETTRTSYGTRVGNSFKGILTGLLMLVGGTVLLWWNEGRSVRSNDATADAYEALGLDAATFEASAEILAQKTSATFEPIDFDETALVNANGYLVSEESEDLAIGFYITMEDGKAYLMIDDIADSFSAENVSVKVRFAIEYNGKRYNYEYTLTNNPEAVSINGIAAKTAKANGKYMENGNIVIGDEMLTPDSSRFWPADVYEPGHGQPSFDKQFARDWLKANPDNDWTLPQDIVDKTIGKYLQGYELLTGKPLV